jgi:hypothetical protein
MTAHNPAAPEVSKQFVIDQFKWLHQIAEMTNCRSSREGGNRAHAILQPGDTGSLACVENFGGKPRTVSAPRALYARRNDTQVRCAGGSREITMLTVAVEIIGRFDLPPPSSNRAVTIDQSVTAITAPWTNLRDHAPSSAEVS